MGLKERDQQYVWHPFTQAQIAPTPLPIVKAEGVWLEDETGNRYLDANSSWWTILHGHCHPHIVKEISKQLAELDHVIFAGATHPKGVEIAERIVKALPDHFAKAFFSDNGSTATEVAIKMVYQYWHNKGTPKKKFVAIEGAYHGDTFGAMSVGERDYFNRPFEHLFFDVDYLPFPTETSIDEVLMKAEEIFSSGEVAGFIFEPLVQGAAGMRIYNASFLDQLLKIAKQYDIITVADEVMTGFYRTGNLFAIEQLKEKVDIICLSKGLTGGVMAMALTVTTQKMYDSFLSDEVAKALLHGHSFTGNPIACAAACASLDILEKPQTLQRIKTISEKNKQFCEQLKDHPAFKSVKSCGTILSLEVKGDEDSSYFSSLREKAYRYFLENEILLRPLGNVIFVNPPYGILNDELEMIYRHILIFVEQHKDLD
ncbi:MAG: adenosylmethionine--8-amino-7-oxononanoate transaminase [Crocinitomicaceae bacterium]